jgi:methylthioribose-1-phosphate isomerase
MGRAAKSSRRTSVALPHEGPHTYLVRVSSPSSAGQPAIESVRWAPGGRAVRIIDQRRLPGEYVERDLATLDDVCDAIRTLAVRGAPAIGICAAMGLVVAAEREAGDGDAFLAIVAELAGRMASTRPTAVNLSWALDRVRRRAVAAGGDRARVLSAMRDEATAILVEDRAMCRAIGERGLSLLTDGARVLTHCNAGALATGGIGTALAPLYLAAERGLHVEAIATETRPLLQGSRLTAWELTRAGIPATLVTDSMVSSLMAAGEVDLCIVGADRIARNGDVANKIGTYGLAVLARHHGIPFHVAAPWSTVSPETRTGADIRIEERDAAEVLALGGVRTAPEGIRVRNPAFDVTPAALVTSIITDRAVHLPPYDFGTGA